MRLLFRHPEEPQPQPLEKDHQHHHHQKKHRLWGIQDEWILMTLLAPVVVSYEIPPWLIRAVALIFGTILSLFLLCWFYVTRWPKKRTIEAMRAVAFQPEMIPPDLDTIVIGSGSGGSTCSNLLAQSGQKVLVLEQHPTATGGCTHSFREQNCKFE